jgi:hypothetical protein
MRVFLWMKPKVYSQTGHAQVAQNKKKQRAFTTSTPSDYDPTGEKSYPNGIRVTAQALWQFWPYLNKETESEFTSLSEFKKNSQFLDAHTSVVERYPGIRDKKIKDAHKIPNDIGKGNFSLRYYHLRVMAEYIDIPVAVFILYTQMVSLERRAEKAGCSKKEVLGEMLDRIERIIDQTRHHLGQKGDSDDIFIERIKNTDEKDGDITDEVLAKLALMKLWRDAFRDLPGK